MYPQPHSIGHYPELVTIEEGHRNVAWPQQICPNPPVNLTPHTHLLNNIPKISTKPKKERANLSRYLASGYSHSKTKQKKEKHPLCGCFDWQMAQHRQLEPARLQLHYFESFKMDLSRVCMCAAVGVFSSISIGSFDYYHCLMSGGDLLRHRRSTSLLQLCVVLTSPPCCCLSSPKGYATHNILMAVKRVWNKTFKENFLVFLIFCSVSHLLTGMCFKFIGTIHSHFVFLLLYFNFLNFRPVLSS